MNGLLDSLHCFYVVQTHKIKAEAVDFVFSRPIAYAVHHKFAIHIAFGCGIVAAARPVGVRPVVIITIVVIRYDFIKIAVGVRSVIVHHVHYYAQAVGVKRLHHLLELAHAHFAVIRVGGIAAFRRVVVLRVVAPVELSRT